jgi:hypothetical protein
MKGFLIDTTVLSEYNRPGGPDAGVKRWLETSDRQTQYVSVITLAEIQKGVELLDPGKRRASLALAWNIGSGKTSRRGFPAGFFQLIVRSVAGGRRSWRAGNG